MCVIVDASVASLVFRDPPDADFQAVFDWLSHRGANGCVVYGGSLAAELACVAGARRYLRALQQAGRARHIPDSAALPEEECVVRCGLCKSNDPHVVALARVSGARTLCSRDTDLHRDFKNPALVSRPRGCVYQTAEHRHLLRHTTSCGWRRTSR